MAEIAGEIFLDNKLFQDLPNRIPPTHIKSRR